jgi:hypothetical protein
MNFWLPILLVLPCLPVWAALILDELRDEGEDARLATQREAEPKAFGTVVLHGE